MTRLHVIVGARDDEHWTKWTPFCQDLADSRCVTIVEILALVLVAAGIALTVVLIRQAAWQ